MKHTFKRTTIIHIGGSTQAHVPLFARVLHLSRLPGPPSQEDEWKTEQVLRSAP